MRVDAAALRECVETIWNGVLGPKAPPLTFEDAGDGLWVRSQAWTVHVPFVGASADLLSRRLTRLKQMTLGDERQSWSGYRARCCQ